MKLKEKEIKVIGTELFKIKTSYKFNCLRLGTAFKKDLQGLIVGGEDGIIRIYDMSSNIETKNPKILLETKGGPIQTMAVHDVTKFYNDDLVTGDSVGMVTIFCNQQILCRHSLAKDSIKCLQIHKDQLGNCSIVTSDESGYICATSPSKELWRININNLPTSKGPTEKSVVTCLLSTDLVTPTGEKCSYILAADDNKHLHFVHQGEVVMTLNTPEIITAMCSGLFIDADKLDFGQDAGNMKSQSQVALGCNNGAIYILHNFTISEEEFGNAKYHITHLIPHQSVNLKVDLLLCAGHFNALHIYHEGKKVGSYETPEWINSMDLSLGDKDKKPEIVVGCSDNSITGINLFET
ncbi:uncharacterized protein LOC132731946 [Ruditapes philippinarum]|uniref:uncharacterized protein LOC132731946 n=1 Tax=Ruditapes philippinarum TaxID=129788 RepID=UPI00295AAB7E|nr:uncharacterized protein LOC132731946 [Ruditapes philippinarum]